MPVELDDNLRRKLVDLLASVPSLRERAGRDAWLINLPRNVQDQIGRRDDNNRRDLRFITDAVQNIQLQDDRWVILILLDNLLEEMHGIKLGDDIQRVRDEITKALGRSSKEPKESPFELFQPEPTQFSDPKRQEWLERLDFRRDPFLYRDGGADPFLQEYFYFDMKHFYDILGDISRPGTNFVFGTPGSGKSSMRNVISQLCRKKDIFPIVYQNFGPLVRKHQRGEEVQVEDHVVQILRTALRTLADQTKESDKEDVSSPETEEIKIIRNQLWLYVSKYEDDPLRKHILKNLMKQYSQAEDALPDDARELLGRFCRYLTKTPSYRFVYVLVDPDEDIAWQVLAPLLSTRRLLELSEDNVAFKFFLSQKLKEQTLQFPWIAEEQSRRIYDLWWSRNELHALLRARLQGCSGVRSYEALAQVSEEVNDLDDRVIKLSGGSPRNLVVICDQLFSEHSRRWSPDDGEPLLITAQEVDEVLQPFEERQRESTLERLIAQGESERLEFKSTMRYNLKADRPDKEMEREIARTLCGFMNTEGGTLIIGVDDNGVVLGLDKDFSTLGRKKNKDGFAQAFVNITENLFNSPASPDDYTARFEESRGKFVYVVEVKKSEKPVFCLFDGVSEFYVRKQTTTRKQDAKAQFEYLSEHFKN